MELFIFIKGKSGKRGKRKIPNEIWQVGPEKWASVLQKNRAQTPYFCPTVKTVPFDFHRIIKLSS